MSVPPVVDQEYVGLVVPLTEAIKVSVIVLSIFAVVGAMVTLMGGGGGGGATAVTVAVVEALPSPVVAVMV